jgi:hypothetical protein
MLFWFMVSVGVIAALIALYFAIFLPMMKNISFHD